MRIPRSWKLFLGFIAFESLAIAVGLVGWHLPGIHRVQADVDLPTRYAGGRFYVEPITETGVKLSLLTDTGGGLFLPKSAVERCGLHSNKFLNRTRLPEFHSDS